jgi:hypothetical protein
MRMSRGWAAMALLATLGVSLLTGSSVSAKENKALGHRTFTLITHPSTGYSKVIDLGEPNTSGLTAGDLLLEEVPLLDPKSGQQVGTGRSHAVVIRVDGGDPMIAVNASDQFREGVIEQQGVFRLSDFQRGFTIAITGGTGAYARARGTVTGRALDADTNEWTYDVLP